MPLTEKGSKIKSEMEEHYGPEKGEQVFYASKNKGTITGVDTMPRDESRPFGMEDPLSKGGSMSDQESMLHPPSLKPEPDLEHPQQHPGESTPPEDCAADEGVPMPSLSDDEEPSGSIMPTELSEDQTAPAPPPPPPVTADINGGITGGAMPQSWGSEWKGPSSDQRFSDALPTEMSLGDILRDGARYWDQWSARPLGPDTK